MLKDLFFRLRSVFRRDTVESEMEEGCAFTLSGNSKSISRKECAATKLGGECVWSSAARNR